MGNKIWIALTLSICLLSACVSEGPVVELTKLKPLDKKERIESIANIKTQLAIEYINSGDYRSAVTAIEEAIKNDPKNGLAWLTRAQIYQFLKVNDKAEEYFHEALKLNPNGAEINNNYGWFLCNVKNNFKESMIYFDKALADPTYPSPEVANLNKGICHARLKEFTKADGYFERALNLDPNFVTVLKEWARSKLEQGDNATADRYFRQYQSLVDVYKSADDLLLGWRIATALGQSQNAYDYEAQLREIFPYSDELNKITTGSKE